MGSVFLIGIVVVILLIAGIFASPLFIIPAVVVAIVGLVATPVLGMFNRGSTAPSGNPGEVPSTGEAAYDPVQEPVERGAGS